MEGWVRPPDILDPASIAAICLEGARSLGAVLRDENFVCGPEMTDSLADRLTENAP